MANNYFQFKQFTIHQDRCAMKVTTDACLFGAWAARESVVGSRKSGVKDLVLDIGTGTGLLSLMVAQTNPGIKIDSVEIDKEAYEQAKENVIASPWAERINIIHSDVKHHTTSKQYDAIISNPPFYENELRSPDSKKNKALHDTGLQLDELLTIVQHLLKPGGRFYVLLPYKRNDEIESLVSKNNLAILHKILIKQSTQHRYFRIMLCGTHISDQNENPITTEIAIKNENNTYTPTFINLLKDYYLYL